MRKGVILLAVALVLLIGIATANTAPLIHDISSDIVVCESSPFSVKFEVVDLDGDSLTMGISPSGPFYVRPISSEPPITKVELFSENLTKALSNKAYEPTIFVSDGEFIDKKDIKITVVESNTPPSIDFLSVETINLDNSPGFQKQIHVTDKESGSTPESFSFSVTDSQDLLGLKVNDTGLITYSPSKAHLGAHSVEVCATDNGLDLEGKIGVCAQEDIKSTTCKKFELAIVEANTPPTILLFNSTNSSSRIASTDKITFQIYKYDPEGLHPDTYWYVDGKLKEIDAGENTDSFTYSFGCEVWGRHKIKATISDGMFNDSVYWVFDVFSVNCLEGTVPREKVGDDVCEEKWGCTDWGLCQNALESNHAGNLIVEEYQDLKQRCEARGWDENTCGYQLRACTDVDNCNTVLKKPLEIIPCYFSLNPGCSDTIQNCHDGGCEFLADCGGPCPEKCVEDNEEPQPTSQNSFAKLSMVLAIIVALAIALIQMMRIIKNKKALEEPSKSSLVVAYE